MSTPSIVVIKDTGVVLYQHWDGYDLYKTVRRAIAKRWRWHDVTYLTRIIFCEMIKGDVGSETGFGIGASDKIGAEYIVEVDCKNETVTHKKASGTVLHVDTFEDCVNNQEGK